MTGQDILLSLRSEEYPHPDFLKLVAALQYMPVGVTVIDRDLTVRFWNEVFCELQDFPSGLMRTGVTMAELFRYIARRGDYGPGDVEEQIDARVQLCLKFEPHHFVRTRSDGVVLEITGRPIYGPGRVVTGFVTIYQDVTSEKRNEEQLKTKNEELSRALEDLKLTQVGYIALEEDRKKYYELAVRDPLTDLFTRIYMDDAANRMIELHERNTSACLCVLLIDIDHFKEVNDTYGHLAGDIVLREVGRLVKEQSRKVDVPVRLGGDEFAIFLAGVGIQEGAAFGSRMQAAIAALRFADDLHALQISISVGVAEHKSEEALLELLRRADDALYEAKRHGRNRVQIAG